jgi:hypothetical protein
MNFWGIKYFPSVLLTILPPIYAGLSLQLAGLGMLFGWQESWAENGQVVKAIVFVTAAQMLCGVAKDLTKLGGKTVTKLVTPDEKEVCVGGGVGMHALPLRTIGTLCMCLISARLPEIGVKRRVHKCKWMLYSNIPRV